MLLTSGTAVNSRTAPVMSPTPQPPPETTTKRPCSGRPSARRAASGQRGRRNSAEISGRTRRALPRPAMRSTEGSDCPYITMCMSMPRCAQKNRPVRSVIVATVGQPTAPVRRSRASTTVTAGYVDTTTSGSWRAIARASGRDPNTHSSQRVKVRIGSTRLSSQYTIVYVHGRKRSWMR